MRYLISVIICVYSFGHLTAQQIIKDTIIDSIKYHFATYSSKGKLKALSENKSENEGGAWLFFDENGEEEWSGNYDSKGRKDGDWWYRKREIIWYKNGKKTGKKGSGCKGCSF